MGGTRRERTDASQMRRPSVQNWNNASSSVRNTRPSASGALTSRTNSPSGSGRTVSMSVMYPVRATTHWASASSSVEPHACSCTSAVWSKYSNFREPSHRSPRSGTEPSRAAAERAATSPSSEWGGSAPSTGRARRARFGSGTADATFDGVVRGSVFRLGTRLRAQAHPPMTRGRRQHSVTNPHATARALPGHRQQSAHEGWNADCAMQGRAE